MPPQLLFLSFNLTLLHVLGHLYGPGWLSKIISNRGLGASSASEFLTLLCLFPVPFSYQNPASPSPLPSPVKAPFKNCLLISVRGTPAVVSSLRSTATPKRGHTTMRHTRPAVTCQIHRAARFPGACVCYPSSVATVQERLASFSPFLRLEGFWSSAVGRKRVHRKRQLSDFGTKGPRQAAPLVCR